MSVDSNTFDSKYVVAHFHEREQVDFSGDDCLLRFCEVELWVGECLQRLAALVLANVARAFQVV